MINQVFYYDPILEGTKTQGASTRNKIMFYYDPILEGTKTFITLPFSTPRFYYDPILEGTKTKWDKITHRSCVLLWPDFIGD